MTQPKTKPWAKSALPTSGVYSYSAVFAVTGFTLLVNLGLVLLFRGKKTTPTD
ncbi:hypothetical protein [Limosilactobacillus fermentum]|uniref:hypothetical protein n=1 Tax=Limosilactobacillus fermentum TaxID=1613 RepID=UPI0012F8AEB2|nr:hypothetical protein [Limosilactobacillus fermentum]